MKIYREHIYIEVYRIVLTLARIYVRSRSRSSDKS